MRGIGLHLLNMFAAHVVKTQHKVGITGEGLRRGHIFHLMLLPQAACAAEGVNAAFGADACARQDDDVFDALPHMLSFIFTQNLFRLPNIVRPRN